MLGAVISFVAFALAVWCWTLGKLFRRFIKGEESMPIFLFSIYCVLCFIILGFVLVVVLSWLPDVLPRPYNYEMAFGLDFIIVTSFIAFQIFLYVKTIKQKNKEGKPNIDISNRLSEIKQKNTSSERQTQLHVSPSNESLTSTISDDSVRFCKYCGEVIDKDTVYCPYCGKKLQNYCVYSSSLSKPNSIEKTGEKTIGLVEDNIIDKDERNDIRDQPHTIISHSKEQKKHTSIIDISESKGCFIVFFMLLVIYIILYNLSECTHSWSSNLSDNVDSDSIEAQIQHMTFMGVEINGSRESFLELVSKSSFKDDMWNCLDLKFKFITEENKNICFENNDGKLITFTPMVELPDTNNVSYISGGVNCDLTYFNYVKSVISKKLGSPKFSKDSLNEAQLSLILENNKYDYFLIESEAIRDFDDYYVWELPLGHIILYYFNHPKDVGLEGIWMGIFVTDKYNIKNVLKYNYTKLSQVNIHSSSD